MKYLITVLLLCLACMAFIVWSGLSYHKARSQPGGDAVRIHYVKRQHCRAEAHVVFQKCMLRPAAATKVIP